MAEAVRYRRRADRRSVRGRAGRRPGGADAVHDGRLPRPGDVPTAVADAYAEAGADLVELGVPFSDPLADGPVIHAAGDPRAGGGRDARRRARRSASGLAARVPVVPMVYANMVLARGAGEFAALLADAGAAGAIVPDLPLEEAGEIAAALRAPGSR